MASPSSQMPGAWSEDTGEMTAFGRCLDLLELLCRVEKPMTVAAASAFLRQGPDKVSDAFQALIDRGYLASAPDGTGFEVTPKILTLAGGTPSMRRLGGLATPLMEGMARRFNSPCHLSVPVEHWAVTIACAEPRTVGFRLQPGHRSRMMISAAGALMFGLGTLDQRERVIAAERNQAGEREWSDFDRRADRARADGYCIAVNDILPDVLDIAVPVFDDDGVRAILVLSSPASVTGPATAAALSSLRDAGQAISRATGHFRRDFGPHVGRPTPAHHPTLRLVK